MTRAPVPAWVLVTLAGVLAGGCAAQHEEGLRSEARYESEAPPDATFEQAAPAEEEEEQAVSLAHMQRELAANNAKLRELGVELPGSPVAREDAEPDADLARPTPGGAGAGVKGERIGDLGELGGGAKGSAGAGTASKSSTSKPTAASRERADKKKPSKDKTAADHVPSEPGAGKAGDGDGVRPEPAKATPISPTVGQHGDAGRCQQICELAEITCEIGGQICELADRHVGEPEYGLACVRASDDCDAAKEACDACIE
jgi:hypothetical protein